MTVPQNPLLFLALAGAHKGLANDGDQGSEPASGPAPTRSMAPLPPEPLPAGFTAPEFRAPEFQAPEFRAPEFRAPEFRPS
ncbi:MAG TPA: hypothetical protein VF815_32920 [Myxococcaceae bacterium]|jgi:hypothetical protein